MHYNLFGGEFSEAFLVLGALYRRTGCFYSNSFSDKHPVIDYHCTLSTVQLMGSTLCVCGLQALFSSSAHSGTTTKCCSALTVCPPLGALLSQSWALVRQISKHLSSALVQMLLWVS